MNSLSSQPPAAIPPAARNGSALRPAVRIVGATSARATAETVSLPAIRLAGSTGETNPELPAQKPLGFAEQTNPVPASALTYPEMAALAETVAEREFDNRESSHTGDELGCEFDDSGEEAFSEGRRITEHGIPTLGPTAARRAVLLRMDGVLAGDVLPLTVLSVTIGRHLSCEIRLDDSGISRRHARIVRSPGRHCVEDLDSRNGTYVQGVRVARAFLNDGDWLQLGPRVTMRYALVDEHQERLLRQLYESSMRDNLTGAYNRKHFEERLRSEFCFATRHHTDAALILIDIDHFKKINDTHGHQAGDAVLRQTATAIRHRLRAEDVFARIGGEEFAVILRGTNRLGASQAAERLRATIAALPAIINGRPVPVTISAGCAALSCCHERSAKELVATADRRLYAAKHRGRNRVVASD